MSRTSSKVSPSYRARVHASYWAGGTEPSQSSDTPPPAAWQNLLIIGAVNLMSYSYAYLLLTLAVFMFAM